MIVAVVARLLPRDWDGQRLLRFVTGLALLALAFAVRVDGIAVSDPVISPDAVVTTTVDAPPTPAPVTETAAGQPAPAAAHAAPTADQPAPAAAQAAPAAPVDTPRIEFAPTGSRNGFRSGAGDSGVVPGAHGSRGPPLT